MPPFDRLWLSDETGVSNWSELQSVWTDTADGALLSFQNGSVLLSGVDTASLVQDDFIFG